MARMYEPRSGDRKMPSVRQRCQPCGQVVGQRSPVFSRFDKLFNSGLPDLCFCARHSPEAELICSASKAVIDPFVPTASGVQ